MLLVSTNQEVSLWRQLEEISRSSAEVTEMGKLPWTRK